MAITISYPLSNSTERTTFSADGTFDVGSGTVPAKCNLTGSDGSNQTVDINLCTNGNWVAALPFTVNPGVTYTCKAFYTDANTGHPVNAQPTTSIMQSNNALKAPAVMCIKQNRRRHTDEHNDAAPNGDSTPADTCAYSDVLSYSAEYPKHLKFHRAVALLFRSGSQDPVAVLPVLAKFGTWSVLVPKPEDFPENPYIYYIVFLDRDGFPVLTGKFGLLNC
jgi:hypothetical protein